MKKIPVPTILTAVTALSAALLLTGCFETKDEFTLNPDGSGKVVHESSFQNVNLSGDTDTSEEALKEAIAKVIEGARGVKLRYKLVQGAKPSTVSVEREPVVDQLGAPALSLVPAWQVKGLLHQSEAGEVFHTNDFLYVGGGGKVAKVNLTDGRVAWSYETGQSYQPSYPVSNGRVVLFGTYYGKQFNTEPRYRTFFVGLDDQTGKLLWKVPAGQQNMSGACFAEDLAFIGSYDKHLYAIDWAKGELRWKKPIGAWIWSTPCVYGDMVIVGGYDGNLHCLDRNTGETRGRIDCGGRIESNPVVVDDLLFVSVDDQNQGDKFDGSKLRRAMLVVDMREKRIVSRFGSDSSFSKKIIVSGNDVYFFDAANLFAFDSRRAQVAWKVQAPPGMTPYPLIMVSNVILAMNYSGHHGEHLSKLVVLDRSTGNQLTAQASGGIGIGQAAYAQWEDGLVTTDWKLAGYRLGTAQEAMRLSRVRRDIEARLSAARKVAAIAADAAREGEVETTRTALQRMTDFTKRDEAIGSAARLLVASGKRADALELARLVTAFPARDALIHELAK